MNRPQALNDIYDRLLARFGPQHWWPGETPFEVMVGAVLTQNTAWSNVEKAIANLKGQGLLDPARLFALPPPLLAEQIRPCGYFNLKAARLHNLLSLIAGRFDGDLDRFFATPLASLRQQLLEVKGIGPETADSILLYAAGKPIFVVDAYTHRLLSRHGLIAEEEADYHQIQALFMDALPADPALFNEYHALIVRVGKEYCKKTGPRCGECPLPAPS
ncbi:MAG: endonuclease III domain-containing protein [Desulfobacteraceae bacterium]|nr:endonuclease III domain-containing protein [Desulfobacteraceae bacterium]